MKDSKHLCDLHIRHAADLTKLPPNASFFRRFRRCFWKLILVNPSNFKCKIFFRNKSAVLTERQRHAKGRYYYVIHPLSKLNSILEGIFVFLWFNNLIVDPLMFFQTSVNVNRRGMVLWMKILLPVRLLIVVSFFDIGYFDWDTQNVIIEPKKIVVRYLTTFFIFDVMATHSLSELLRLIFFKVFAVSKLTRAALMNFNYIVRILACCVRLKTLLTFFDDTLTCLKVGIKARIIFVHILKTFIFLHLFAFLLFYIPIMSHLGDEISEESWLDQADLNNEKTMSECYFESFVVASLYFFGVTYKYNITLTSEQICVAIVSFVGRLYTLYLIADILYTFDIVGVSESIYDGNKAMLQRYIVTTDVPIHLRQKLIKYYEFKFQRRYFKEEAVMHTLSESLRTELFLHSARMMINKVKVFNRLPSVTLGALIAAMKAEIYSPKDIIVKLTSDIDELYFISSGTVAVMNKHGLEVCHLEDGDEFGMSSFIYKKQLHAVVAIETTEIFIIKKADFLKFLKPFPEIMKEFYKASKEKLDNMLLMEDERVATGKDLLYDLKTGTVLELPQVRPIVKN